MTRSPSLLASLLLSVMLVFVATDAEAKRFGGGKSFGKSYSTPKQSPFSSNKATTQAPTNTATKSGIGSKGLIGGLLAGGLLGALFFGGGFEGIQMMDILLIAAIAFLGIKLMRQFSRGRQPASASQYAAPPFSARTEPESGGATTTGAAPAPGCDLPPGFNAQQFLEEAKNYYQELQTIWDQKNFSELADYVTPELLAELKQAREEQVTPCTTKVISVNTELLRAQHLGENASISIRFTGWIQEDEAEATGFDDVWHLERPWERPGSWIIVGIEHLS